MSRNLAAVVGVVLVAVAALALVPRQHLAAEGAIDDEARIVFVCQNGVAMSVWSALTFDRLAAARGLRYRAVSRSSAATFTQVPARMRFAIALEGYEVGTYRPQVVSASDIRSAARVILIDTDLPASASFPGAEVERWDGFPPMREKYFESRAALRARVEALVARLVASSRRLFHIDASSRGRPLKTIRELQITPSNAPNLAVLGSVKIPTARSTCSAMSPVSPSAPEA